MSSPPDDIRDQLARLERENAALRARAATEAERRELAPFEQIGGAPAPGMPVEELARRRRKGRRIRLALVALGVGLAVALVQLLIRDLRTAPREESVYVSPAPGAAATPAPATGTVAQPAPVQPPQPIPAPVPDLPATASPE